MITQDKETACWYQTAFVYVLINIQNLSSWSRVRKFKFTLDNNQFYSDFFTNIYISVLLK